MKVLYLDHPEADYLSAPLYMGLCQELGPENVIDHPYKRSYHGEIHTYPSPYAIDLSGEGLPWQRPAKEGPDAMGTTAPFDWMIAQPGREWSHDEVIDRLGEFSLIVFAAPRLYNTAALRDIVRAVGREKLPPLVLVDGEDYWQIRTDLVQEFRPSVYFKRELMPGSGSGCRLEPFPLISPVMVPPEPVDKDIDILFLGGRTWGARDEACAALKQAFGDRFVGGVEGFRPGHAEYLKTLARARVAISVRGFGFDTLRVWEIPAMPGTLLVGDRLPIIRPFPLVDREHALYFGDTKELVEAVRCALEDEPWRQRIAQAGNEHFQKYHTARARAKQLLDISLGS
jgi:hypothetical protein